MIVKSQGELCLDCHSDVGDAIATATTRHDPASGGECTACHNPHKGKLNRLLLADPPDLCTGCHQATAAELGMDNVHPPAAESCLGCHLPHAAAEAALLTQRAATLCADCHDLEDEAFSGTHLGIDPAVMDCMRCHAPHASQDPRLIRANQHAPFAAGSCSDCHLVAQE
jgi:predicted CXXCH cytochrome family protein